MKKENFTILVDMDDTIENLREAWVEALNNKYNLNVRVKDIIDWNIQTFFPTLTKAQIFEILDQPDFYKTIKPKKDAIKYLHLMHEEGFNLILCTASHYSIIKEKFENALFPYFPFFDDDHIIITNNKTIIKANVLIDDGVHNLLKGSYKKILYTTSANSRFNEEEKYKIIRASTWKQIYEIVKTMYKDESEKHNRKTENKD